MAGFISSAKSPNSQFMVLIQIGPLEDILMRNRTHLALGVGATQVYDTYEKRFPQTKRLGATCVSKVFIFWKVTRYVPYALHEKTIVVLSRLKQRAKHC